MQTVKNLIRKCRETGNDIHLALLDLRTTPRDDLIGSPMERLMGRKAQTLLPSAESLLTPATRDPEMVHKGLSQYRKLQKMYHDRGAKPLRRINSDRDGIRMRGAQGWEPAQYIQESHDNSHIVKSGGQGRLYRRNRRDLRMTNEGPHRIEPVIAPLPALPKSPYRNSPYSNTPNRNRQSVSRNSSENTSAQASQSEELPNSQVTTRSGRQIRAPTWMKDMIKT